MKKLFLIALIATWALNTSAQHEFFLEDNLDQNKMAKISKLGISQEIRDEFNPGKNSTRNVYVKYFDTQGRPVKSVQLTGESEVLLREYTYDSEGRLVKMLDNIPDWTYDFTYDSQGRIIRILIRDNLLEDVVDSLRYEYSPEGKIISSASTGYTGEQADWISTYKYDEKGRFASKVTAVDDITYYEYHVSYDEKGRIKSTREYSAGTWTDHRFTYSPEGLLTEETSEGEKVKLVYKISYE